MFQAPLSPYPPSPLFPRKEILKTTETFLCQHCTGKGREGGFEILQTNVEDVRFNTRVIEIL